ncbi:MAG: hypothetical protein ABL921_01115 [Pirellula sp.]
MTGEPSLDNDAKLALAVAEYQALRFQHLKRTTELRSGLAADVAYTLRRAAG